MGKRHGSLFAFAVAAQLRAYTFWRAGALADAEARRAVDRGRARPAPTARVLRLRAR